MSVKLKKDDFLPHLILVVDNSATLHRVIRYGRPIILTEQVSLYVGFGHAGVLRIIVG